MSSEGMMRPYIVAAFFSNGAAGHMAVGTQEGVNEADATSRLVAGFYLGGGKLPLVAMSVLSPRRDVLENALKMLDAIDAADKAEAAKVVNLVLTPVPTQPGDNGAELPPECMAQVQRHEFMIDPTGDPFASECSFCGKTVSDPIHNVHGAA